VIIIAALMLSACAEIAEKPEASGVVAAKLRADGQHYDSSDPELPEVQNAEKSKYEYDTIDALEKQLEEAGKIIHDGDFCIYDTDRFHCVYSTTVPFYVITHVDYTDSGHKSIDEVFEGDFDGAAYASVVGEDSPECENCSHVYLNSFVVSYKNPETGIWCHEKFRTCSVCGHVDARGEHVCLYDHVTCRGACDPNF